MKRNFSVLFFLAAAVFFACRHEPIISPVTNITSADSTKINIDSTRKTDSALLAGAPCNKDTAYFSDVLPIFKTYCSYGGSCHDDVNRHSGYQLTDYMHVLQKGLLKGDPSRSQLYTKMQDGIMPPGQKLSAAQLTLIQKWILQGALNNSCK